MGIAIDSVQFVYLIISYMFMFGVGFATVTDDDFNVGTGGFMLVLLILAPTTMPFVLGVKFGASRLHG